MSGDGADRGGAGAPDDSTDGTDWLLSQLDEDETGAIETQADAAGLDYDTVAVDVPPVSDPVAPQAVTPPAVAPQTLTPPTFTPPTVAPQAVTPPTPTAQPFTPEPFEAAPAAPPTVPATETAAEDDDRTQVLPVIEAQHAPRPDQDQSDPEPIAAPSNASVAPAAPAASAAPAHPGEFATEAELLAWWQSQVSAGGATAAQPTAAQPAAAQPTAEPSAAEVPATSTEPEPVAPSTDIAAETAPDAPAPAPRLHPNALQLPVIPPTPAPAAPVPPVLNELTVDTDSVLQHAPAGTFRPAPTNPVVLPPVDDEPWSLGNDDDDVPSAPEDVATAALPIAGALAAGDPTAWAAVDAEHPAPAVPPVAASTATPAAGVPTPPAPAAGAPETPAPATVAPGLDLTSGPATGTAPDDADDDLPAGSWSLSETFGDDVLDGEIVEVREPDAQTTDPVDLPAAGPDTAATETLDTADTADAAAPAPRTDPLEWLTVPFGQTFGATTAAPDALTEDTSTPAEPSPTVPAESPISAPVDIEPIGADDTAAERTDDEFESLDTTPIASAVLRPEQPTEPDASVENPVVESPVFEAPAADTATVETAAVEAPGDDLHVADAEPASPAPKAPLRWDSPAPTTPAPPSSPADVPWPEPTPSAEGEVLDETRPFDSLGGPGLLPVAGAAAAAAAVSPQLFTPADSPADASDDADTASDGASVPPAFGPPTPPAERSITELISLDGVQPEPVVSPFGDAPFVWDLAPNDALDPLVHAAPTTQPIAVPAVQWEATEPAAAVSDDSPSELALEGEVPDAAFVAGDLGSFAPGLGAETLGRPLVDGPGDEFGSWTDDSVEETVATPGETTPTVAAANDTVDLFPTLSLGGLDASLDAAAVGGVAAGAGLVAAGAGAAAATAGGPSDDVDDTADTDTDTDAEDATASGDAPSQTVDAPAFAVDPEELDDEFDEEIVQFDAIPLSAAGVAPLPSFVPEDAAPVEVPTTEPDAAPVVEPEPVSEELRLESLFDLGPDTDLVEVVPPAQEAEPLEAAPDTTDAAPIDAAVNAATPVADVSIEETARETEPATDAAEPSTDAAPAGAASSLADAFAAEGGWSLAPDAAEAPDLPLAPVPGLVAGDGTAGAVSPVADGSAVPTATAEIPVAPEAEASPAAEAPVAPDAPGEDGERGDAVPLSTPAFGSVVGTPAAAVPSHGPVVPAAQTAPAALPGETVAFPELDASGALGQATPVAGVVGASLPPQAVQTTPERDLPEYRGERTEQSIPKALIWTVVGLGAAVLLLLAFYFGTLVGAGTAGAAVTESTSNTTAAVVVGQSEPVTGLV